LNADRLKHGEKRSKRVKTVCGAESKHRPGSRVHGVSQPLKRDRSAQATSHQKTDLLELSVTAMERLIGPRLSKAAAKPQGQSGHALPQNPLSFGVVKPWLENRPSVRAGSCALREA
jgi:hypothetical protein